MSGGLEWRLTNGIDHEPSRLNAISRRCAGRQTNVTVQVIYISSSMILDGMIIRKSFDTPFLPMFLSALSSDLALPHKLEQIVQFLDAVRRRPFALHLLLQARHESAALRPEMPSARFDLLRDGFRQEGPAFFLALSLRTLCVPLGKSTGAVPRRAKLQIRRVRALFRRCAQSGMKGAGGIGYLSHPIQGVYTVRRCFAVLLTG